MKLIIILRHPIDRAFSHWNMERDRQAESLAFREAIRSESERCRQALPYQHRVFSYIDRGFYVEQLRRIWAYFPKSQTLVLRNEELKVKPEETLSTIGDFLGVKRMRFAQHKDVHSRPYVVRMSREEWKYLRDVFEYEILTLERLLGWDCRHWLRNPES